MLVASSVRYGGLIVDAQECDYQSYLELGLLCPICKQTVFLAREGHREAHTRKLRDGTTTQVKAAATVAAHFRHHPDVSKSQIDLCELRSSQLTVADRERIAHAARHQRARTMSARMWTMLSSSINYSQVHSDNIAKYFEIAYGAEPGGRNLAGVCNWFADRFIVNKTEAKERISMHVDTLLLEATSNPDSPRLSGVAKDGIANWNDSIVDLRMHKAICVEVLDFLGQKRQKPLVDKLARDAIASMVLREAVGKELGWGSEYDDSKRIEAYRKFMELRQVPDDWQPSGELIKASVTIIRHMPQIDNEEAAAVTNFIYTHMLDAIVLVSWADQFKLFSDK